MKQKNRVLFFSFGSNSGLLFRFFLHIGLVLLWRKTGEAGRALLRPSSAIPCAKQNQLEYF